jgi:hypothetical protein
MSYVRWQYLHTWINGHGRMSLGKYWKTENLTIFIMCDKWEQEYMCWARLTHWVWSCQLLYYIWKGKQDCSHIYARVWCWWELIHLTSRLRLGYSGIIDVIVFLYNCIKVFNRLASEGYFLTLEIQLIWISTSQTELSRDSSCWRSSRQIAPRTNLGHKHKSYDTIL